MCYRCEVCMAVSPPGRPKLRHTIHRVLTCPGGGEVRQIARELEVCPGCNEALANGAGLDEMLKQHRPDRQPPVLFAKQYTLEHLIPTPPAPQPVTFHR